MVGYVIDVNKLNHLEDQALAILKNSETEKQKDNIIIDIGGRVPKEICPDLSTSLLTRELSKNTKRGTNTIVIVHIKFKTKVCKKVHVTKEV